MNCDCTTPTSLALPWPIVLAKGLVDVENDGEVVACQPHMRPSWGGHNVRTYYYRKHDVLLGRGVTLGCGSNRGT